MTKPGSRRSFIQKTLVAGMGLSLSPTAISREWYGMRANHESKPWIELSESAYLHNAAQISQMAGGKPVVAVLKNNAYGLGAPEVARILNDSSHIFGMAVVKDETALAMRANEVTKPILLMGDFDTILAKSLFDQKVTLSVYSMDAFKKIATLARQYQQAVRVALYIDTGLGRMGIPFEEAVNVARRIQEQPLLKLTQTFSTLTTPTDFATEQIKRFHTIIRQMNALGIDGGLKHLAPSSSLLQLPDSHVDAVRPGILLHGSFPSAQMEEAQQYPLQVTYRLKAPIIRLEKLKAGDTIGFSRFYEVTQDEWIATLPVGWADGYYSGAENGAMVLLGGRLLPVVNVNASHTNIALGAQTNFKVGDIATLIGPDKPEITPEGFGKLAGGHNYLQINYKESLTKHIHATF